MTGLPRPLLMRDRSMQYFDFGSIVYFNRDETMNEHKSYFRDLMYEW